MSRRCPRGERAALKTDSTIGRILLALRAGEITRPALMERFSDSESGVSFGVVQLIKLGYIARIDTGPDRYRITPAGRAACPSRRKSQGEAACA